VTAVLLPVLLPALSNRRTRRGLVAAGAGLPVLVLVLVLGLAVGVGGGALGVGDSAAAAGTTPVAACGPVVAGQPAPPLTGPVTAEQLGNATVVYTVARQMALPDQAVLVADTAALTESTLVNLDHGDRDSLGLFQQRPSQGWGTPGQIMDPVYATTAFFQHLLAVPGWQTGDPAVLAQTVEASAHPERYAAFVPLAARLVATAAGTAGCGTNGGGPGAPAATRPGGTGPGGTGPGGTGPGGGGPGNGAGLPAGYALPAGTPTAVVRAITFATGQIGKPYVFGSTGPDSWDCSSLVQAAYAAAGITLPRTTFEQVGVGAAVYDPAALQPGDLVFIAGSDGTDTAPGHVGLYLGTVNGVGYVLHAPYTGTTVQVNPLTEFGPLAALRRVTA